MPDRHPSVFGRTFIVMKFYLSSYQLGDEPRAFLDLLGSNKKIALIMNATDSFGDGRRAHYVAKYSADFAELGLVMTDLDLRSFYGAPDKLEKALEPFGALWVAGGNTFCLRASMAKSGLDRLLPHLLMQESLVYGGFGAGACILGPTLKGIHLVEEIDKVPASELRWEGLGLIDFCIVPHFRSPHPKSPAMEKVVDYYNEKRIKFQTLQDGEAVTIVGSRFSKVRRPQ